LNTCPALTSSPYQEANVAISETTTHSFFPQLIRRRNLSAADR